MPEDDKTPEQSGDDEYAAAFEELSKAADAEGDEQVGAAPDGEPVRDDAAPDDAAPPAEDNGAAEEAAPAKSGEVDWSAAPPELREAHEKALETQKKRFTGQVSAYGREIHDLRTKLSSTAAPEGAASDEDAATGDAEISLSQVREDYPDIAGPILDAVEKIAKENQQLLATEQGRREAVLQANNDTLLEKHPDFYDAIAEKRAEFDNWLENEAPAKFGRIVASNNDAIMDPEGAATVFEAFKATIDPQPEPQKKDVQDARRQRQKQGSMVHRPGKTGATTSPGVDPDSADFDAHFAELAAKKDAERRKAAI